MKIVLVHFAVLPEHIERFMAAAESNARASLQEPGCLRFDVLQHSANPAHVWLYEIYRDEDAITAHQQTEHFKQWRQETEGMLARPTITHRLVNYYPPDSERSTE
jgi:(4S)-4-hydroxy-5-phosphonooxypentane-2,3-dione isomerase